MQEHQEVPSGNSVARGGHQAIWLPGPAEAVMMLHAKILVHG